MKPLRDRGKKIVDHGVRDLEGRKQCGSCHEWLPEDHYNLNAHAKGGLEYSCRTCRNLTRREMMYGLTPDAYSDLIKRQGGVCAVCKAEPSDVRSLHVDHDHACCPGEKSSCGQCVRGLLCHACNLTLGLVKDDPTHLASLIDYLTYRQNRLPL